MPRTTTELRRIRLTAPAPRVVYHRTVSGTAGQCEPPDTTMPGPLEEPRPLKPWKPDVLDRESWLCEEVAEPDPLPVPLEPVEAWTVDVPGIVAALTAAKTPTPATAATATQVVTSSSSFRAASRCSTRASVGFTRSMVTEIERMCSTKRQRKLRGSLERHDPGNGGKLDFDPAPP